MTKIVCYFKLDWGKLESSNLSYELGQFSHKATSLSGENHLQSISLFLISSFVEKESKVYFCLTITCPDITSETSQPLIRLNHLEMFLRRIVLYEYGTQ